jgi:nitrous oxidase accessory protein
VRLFSVLVEQSEPSIILLRSFFLDLLDLAERVAPVITPERLVDQRPLMRWRST